MPRERPRRVLILVENLSVPFDRRVWKECCALSEAGYQVTAISPKGADVDLTSRETINGVAVYRYTPFESSGSALSYAVEYGVALAMTSVLAWIVFFRRGFDVIQLCNPPDLLILVALPFKLFGKKVIFDQHDLSPEIYAVAGTGHEGGIIHRTLLFCEFITYRYSDVVICTTLSFCEIAKTRGRVPHDKLFLVRNGPDLNSFVGATPDPGLRQGKRFLLSYVGMMGPQDGVDALLRCIRLLLDEFHRNDFHVYLVGGGTELNRLQNYARELGIADYVTFAGKRTYDGVVTAVASADVCVCPDPKTPMNDRSNLVKVTEYMCLGRPVVSFDLVEVGYSASNAALYAEPGNEHDFAAKIDYLLDRPEERERLGSIGAQRVRDLLSWDHSKLALYSAYDRAFSETRLDWPR
jgi:glycosyltransferase involved in cell wall biosynthesis